MICIMMSRVIHSEKMCSPNNVDALVTFIFRGETMLVYVNDIYALSVYFTIIVVVSETKSFRL